MPSSDAATPIAAPRRTRLGAVLLGVLGTLTVYMIWIGVSGRAIPEWFYWISVLL